MNITKLIQNNITDRQIDIMLQLLIETCKEIENFRCFLYNLFDICVFCAIIGIIYKFIQ